MRGRRERGTWRPERVTRMMAAGVSFVNTLKRSIPKKPKMVANFSRNAGRPGGFMKISGGMQSRSRKARRESGFAGRALWMPRVTVATKWDDRNLDVQPALRHSIRTWATQKATVEPCVMVGCSARWAAKNASASSNWRGSV